MSKLLTSIADDLRLSREIIEELEWSGEQQGPGSSMGAHDGWLWPACPMCGGLKEKNGDFIESAVGHRSGCKIALFLKRPTVLEEGETGSLAL